MNITRRDFLMSASLLAASPALAKPVRSIMSARETGSATSGQWDNPYITDGLVAMYDGEWNVAPFEHDDYADVWKDLSGNRYDLAVDSSVAYFTDRSFVIQPSSVGALGTQVLASADGNTTTQSAMRDLGYKYSTSNVYIFGGPWYMLCKRANNISASFSDYVGNTRVRQYQIGYDGSADLRTSTDVSIVRNGPGNGRIYLGDEAIATSLTSAGATYSPPSGIMVAAAQYGTEYFNIRFYNRELTAEEIAFNNQIDRERFGL